MVPPASAVPGRQQLLEELGAAGVETDASARRIAEYSYDASNYRVPPIAVAFPRSPGQVRTVVSVCRRLGIPVVPRGGGTGQAGSAIGRGLVVDLSRHLTAIRSIDADAARADVDPGVVLSDLAVAAERHTDGALTFAPDPSSRTRATVGGSIANDACGNHSVRYGRMGDHILELDVVTADGALVTLTGNGIRPGADDDQSTRRAAELDDALRRVTADELAVIRTELGRIPRQVSGYHLEYLLPENGFDVATAFAGSEGSLGIVVGARLRLVEAPSGTVLLVLGYADVVDAAADVPLLLPHRPSSVEGIDRAIVATMAHRRGPEAVTALPHGAAWLLVEVDGPDLESSGARAGSILEEVRLAGHALDGRVVTDPVERRTLWRIREDGAGLSSRLAPEVARGRTEAATGWEDAAVAPEKLADYLRDLRDLLAAYDLDAVMYGHFGAGCMHVRITFDLRTPEGVAIFERYLQDAARLVVRHGGSLSGEHGDGRARSALLPIMYSPKMMSLFARVKGIWDPDGILNPGTIVDPFPVTADLALADVPDRDWGTSIAKITPSGPDGFVQAVQSCIGVGKCRTTDLGVMCPSYRATRDEKDSTRARARVLQEMVRTSTSVPDGWASPEVADSLDLCLACKACSTDCPTGVDMARLKSEFLWRHFAGRRRPGSHYTLGRLPELLPALSGASGLVNALGATPLARAGMRLAGLTAERPMPRIAGRHDWAYAAAAGGASRPGSGSGDVLLFADTFTRAFRPSIAGSAAAVLTGAGHKVECAPAACCGLPAISTGQLDRARRAMQGLAEALDDGTDRPVVVLEPSCASAIRDDLTHLVESAAAARVAARTTSFAGHIGGIIGGGSLAAPGCVPDAVVLQTHCHEYATFGATLQREILSAAGVREVIEASGCCGVAGNFGFEANHYDVSMAVAATSLRPALDSTGADVPVLTDGFSCHAQVSHIAVDRRSLHLAQLLDPRTKEWEGIAP